MSSPSKESLQFVPELLEIAREYSMLGNYKQSCLIYDSITERLSAFLKLNEKNQIWSSMKQMIESEVSLVRELYQSTQHLKPKKVPAVSRLVDHFGVEPFSNMNQSQDPLQQPFDNFEVNEVIQKNPKYIRKPPVNPNLNKVLSFIHSSFFYKSNSLFNNSQIPQKAKTKSQTSCKTTSSNTKSQTSSPCQQIKSWWCSTWWKASQPKTKFEQHRIW